MGHLSDVASSDAPDVAITWALQYYYLGKEAKLLVLVRRDLGLPHLDPVQEVG